MNIHTMIFNEELRNWIQNSFGKQIESKSDAAYLSLDILTLQKEYLSESTIRRFFNLIPTGKTSRTSLDVFSRYVGFSTYQQFCNFCEQMVREVVHSDVDHVALTAFHSKKIISLFEMNLITNRLIQIIKNDEIELLENYFNHDALFKLIKSNKSTSDLFAQALGPYFSFELNTIHFNKIINTKYFAPLILHHYVDVGNHHFDPYYQWLFVNGKTSQEFTFSASILALNHVLKEEWNEAKFYYTKIEKENWPVSPPLAGRLALLDWIFSNDLDALLKVAKKFTHSILYFSIDIIPYVIVIKNWDVLKQWFHHFPDIVENNNSWVEKDIIHMTKIASYIATDKIEACKALLEQKQELMNSNWLNNKAYRIIKEMYSVED